MFSKYLFIRYELIVNDNWPMETAESLSLRHGQNDDNDDDDVNYQAKQYFHASSRLRGKVFSLNIPQIARVLKTCRRNRFFPEIWNSAKRFQSYYGTNSRRKVYATSQYSLIRVTEFSPWNTIKIAQILCDPKRYYSFYFLVIYYSHSGLVV